MENKKKIKLKETDWYSEEYYGKNLFYRILAEKYEIENSENPDYVLAGPCGYDHLKFNDAVKIYVTGECVCPDFNLFDYAVSFEHIQFGDRHLRYPLWLQYSDEMNRAMETKHLDVTEQMAKREFCAFVVSNGSIAESFREKLFDALSEYKSVASGGRYRNNIGKPDGVEDKIEFQKNYKFTIACENCSHEGYTTEKLVEAFASKTIPIYWGDPRICETFNPKSFINCNDYSSIEEIVAVIKEIDQNDELYLSMLRTPALLREEDRKEVQSKKIYEFLYHIFEQEKEDAYRRNRTYWGKHYSNIISDGNNALKNEKARLQRWQRILKPYNWLKGFYKKYIKCRKNN